VKKQRFSEEQIIGILRQAERGEQTIDKICRAHGVAEQSFYRWRQTCGGMQASEASRRLRELERETARLKRLLADRDLEIDAFKELLAKKW
jgi:putative transposase